MTARPAASTTAARPGEAPSRSRRKTASKPIAILERDAVEQVREGREPVVAVDRVAEDAGEQRLEQCLCGKDRVHERATRDLPARRDAHQLEEGHDLKPREADAEEDEEGEAPARFADTLRAHGEARLWSCAVGGS
jgi:hypothetical protein